jgi:hypothetical protein
MYGILIASVGAIVLTLASSESFAASKGAHLSHRMAAHGGRHHHRLPGAFVWGDDGYFYGPTGEAVVGGVQPLTGDVRNSNASDDIPWDWAHRYPPILGPTGRPYVSSCGAETVTVPDGRGGTGQVNVIRCF